MGPSSSDFKSLRDICPELQFLLHSARPEPRVQDIMRLIKSGVDWQAVLALARRHAVRPLLFRCLKTTCWDKIPPPIRLQLEHFARENAIKNMQFAGEMLRVLDAFQRASIQVAIFKGVVLAQVLYGDVSMREFCDLDILVPAPDLQKAEDVILACGYRANFADREFRTTFASQHGQYTFHLREMDIFIDLHWQLFGKRQAFLPQTQDVWERLCKILILGREIPTFSVEDLALFLASHGTKEQWTNLQWLSDFAHLIRVNNFIDWAAVLDRAQRSRSSRPLLLAGFLASSLLDTPVPAELLNQAKDDLQVRTLALKAQDSLLRGAIGGEVAEFFNGLSTYDRLRHKLLSVATLLTTRTVGDYHAMPLPKSLWGIYYLTRPLRLASKVAKMVLRPREFT
jgi:hypothetical protein